MTRPIFTRPLPRIQECRTATGGHFWNQRLMWHADGIETETDRGSNPIGLKS